MATIVSFIPEEDHVKTARQALTKAGIPEDKINVVSQPQDVWRRLHGRKKIRVLFRTVAVGALLGAVVGLLAAIPAGYFNCAKQACTVQESLIFATLIAVYFAFAGGLLAAFASVDKFENDVLLYVDGVLRGEPLFVIEAPEGTAEQARHILTQEHGILVHRD
jgi:hypothetical protein